MQNPRPEGRREKWTIRRGVDEVLIHKFVYWWYLLKNLLNTKETRYLIASILVTGLCPSRVQASWPLRLRIVMQLNKRPYSHVVYTLRIWCPLFPQSFSFFLFSFFSLILTMRNYLLPLFTLFEIVSHPTTILSLLSPLPLPPTTRVWGMGQPDFIIKMTKKTSSVSVRLCGTFQYMFSHLKCDPEWMETTGSFLVQTLW